MVSTATSDYATKKIHDPMPSMPITYIVLPIPVITTLISIYCNWETFSYFYALSAIQTKYISEWINSISCPHCISLLYYLLVQATHSPHSATIHSHMSSILLSIKWDTIYPCHISRRRHPFKQREIDYSQIWFMQSIQYIYTTIIIWIIASIWKLSYSYHYLYMKSHIVDSNC